uniref:Uncharacterized protein n=1 Tax=Lygus hesperus TaxID=30085 RepID=A0A0A9YDN2_LYGHE
MSSFLDRINKASSVVELQSVETLCPNTPYLIHKFVKVVTRFGPGVQVYLQSVGVEGYKEEYGAQDEEEGRVFRIYLPRRIAATITENDIDEYNQKSTPQMVLIYRGKVGNAFNVEFLPKKV